MGSPEGCHTRWRVQEAGNLPSVPLGVHTKDVEVAVRKAFFISELYIVSVVVPMNTAWRREGCRQS